MAKINVFLKIYLQADSEAESQKFVREVEDQLRLLAPIEEFETEPYWKIPNYYGVFTKFAQVDESEQLYLTILQQSEHGWSSLFEYTDPSAHFVWNSTHGSRLFSNSVKWASVVYIRVADNPCFSIGQKVRVIGTSPKTEEVHGLIGTILALPSTDDQLNYGVFFHKKEWVWSVSEDEMEAVD